MESFEVAFKKICSNAFTLAEVLITLGILGVVCAMTIPTLMHDYQEHEFKVSYRKAYSDISNAFSQAMVDETLTPRISQFDSAATASEWEVMQNAFKIVKTCDTSQLNSCWADGDLVCTGTCGANAPSTGSSESFIDISGRSWAEYRYNENIYLVDTNGFKNPNKFGQDRWMFILYNSNNQRVMTGLPSSVRPSSAGDTTSKSAWCNYPPCYYQSWLLGK